MNARRAWSEWFSKTRRQAWAAEAKPYATVYAARLLSVAVGIALTTASARMLGPSGRGEFAFAAAGVAIGVQLFNLGLSSSLLVLFSRNQDSIARRLPSLWLLAAGLAALLAVSGLALANISSTLVDQIRKWWFFWAFWIPIQLLGLYHSAGLNALRSAKAIAWLEIGGRLLAVGLGMTALFVFSGQVVSFVTALLISDALISLAGGTLLWRKRRPNEAGADSATRPFLGQALRLGLKAYSLLLLPYLLIKTDLLLLQFLRSARETGIYSISSQVIDFGLILPASIVGLGTAAVIGASDPPSAVLRLFRPVIYLVSAGAIAVALFGLPMIRFLFGAAYQDAYLPLLILLPGLICLSGVTTLSPFFASQDYPLFLSVYWGVGVLVNLGLNIELIPRYGMNAAAFTSSLGYGLVFGLVSWRFCKEGAVPLRRLIC